MCVIYIEKGLFLIGNKLGWWWNFNIYNVCWNRILVFFFNKKLIREIICLGILFFMKDLIVLRLFVFSESFFCF